MTTNAPTQRIGKFDFRIAVSKKKPDTVRRVEVLANWLLAEWLLAEWLQNMESNRDAAQELHNA